MKRIITVQDISCVGKCSLTAALPIISACGIETCVLPTAMLSAHTAFRHFTFHDLTDQIQPAAACFRQEQITFDAIYTGYLGTAKQIDLMNDFFRTFQTEDNLIFVDPVMADNGRLYTGFDRAYAEKYVSLCGQADVIVPNITEACFLLDRPYIGTRYTQAQIEELLVSLSALGAKHTVLTGVSFCNDELGVMAYDAEKKSFFSYFTERIPANFHGTGDVFSSAAVGALVRGKTLPDALKLAADFTVRAIKATVNNPVHNWYGVDFETELPFLIGRINEDGNER